jgi:hypothetical protein
MNKHILFAHPLSPYSRKVVLEHAYHVSAPHADDPDIKAASPLAARLH